MRIVLFVDLCFHFNLELHAYIYSSSVCLVFRDVRHGTRGYGVGSFGAV